MQNLELVGYFTHLRSQGGVLVTWTTNLEKSGCFQSNRKRLKNLIASDSPSRVLFIRPWNITRENTVHQLKGQVR